LTAAIRLIGVSKTFIGGVTAVDGVSLELEGEVLYGFVGPNGAGKSTLVNLISGYLLPDEGEIIVNGVPIVDFHQALSEAGVVKIEQHPNLAPNLTPAEHLALLLPNFLVDVNVLKRRAEKLLENLGVPIDLDRRVEDLPISQQRVFEIIKALIMCELLRERGKKPVLILDEATAFLPIQQKVALKRILRELTTLGYTIILISHDLSEVIDVSDEILVMSGGKIVARMKSTSLDISELVKSMFEVVLEPTAKIERIIQPSEKEALIIKKLKVRDDRGKLVVRDLDLTIYEGEVHGVAVLPGTGEKELAECIYGVRKAEEGKIIFLGEDVTNKSVYEMKLRGVSFLSDDRIRDGLILDASVEDNLTIGSERLFTYFKGLLIDSKRKLELANRLIREYDILVKNLKAPVLTLSGGNMQRVYLGRVLGREQKLLIALHPTVGLDPMGTKLFFEKISERKRKRLTTLIFSPNIKELLAACDRVSVMSNGRIVATLKPEETTVEKVGMLVSGVA